ncbi:hypothetical protein J8273_7704 [Carpediemonas membranifera]|uniref:Uncharacterized protein n=1 Tax=Carpediemonas membranifera TaxID=201153 RepID=A0A8J6E766_9EUKA|nr:hypothetical protein J8273_7704 [Carpediemonas membranifera]|eukprot:KAG9390355.1 hypothetical protein J8273_7704 [Carpediemonas membranifera]
MAEAAKDKPYTNYTEKTGAYCAFVVPTGIRYSYKPYIDQILYTHATSDRKSKERVRHYRHLSATTMKQAILDRRRLYSANHVERALTIARRVHTYRALRERERRMGVLDVDITPWAVSCGTKAKREELAKRGWSLQFLDPLWKEGQAAYRRKTRLRWQTNKIREHLFHVDEVCRAKALERAHRAFIRDANIIEVPTAWFTTNAALPSVELLARLSMTPRRPTRAQLRARHTAAVHRRESALREVRTKAHTQTAKAADIASRMRRQRALEARRITISVSRSRTRPSPRLHARLTFQLRPRSSFIHSSFLASFRANQARKQQIAAKTAFARKEIAKVDHIQHERLVAAQKAYLLDVTGLFKKPWPRSRAKPAVQRRLETRIRTIRPATSLQIYHANQRRGNIIFARQWACRRHWARVRVISTKYRAGRTRRPRGGVTWTVPNPEPVRSRPRLEARLRARPEAKLAGTYHVMQQIASLRRAQIAELQRQRIEGHVLRGQRNVRATRLAQEAAIQRLGETIEIEQSFVSSCRDAIMRDRMMLARVASIKLQEARRRKALHEDLAYRTMVQQVDLRLKLADIRKRALARQRRMRLRASDLHARRVRLRRSLRVKGAGVIGAAADKAIAASLEEPVLGASIR